MLRSWAILLLSCCIGIQADGDNQIFPWTTRQFGAGPLSNLLNIWVGCSRFTSLKSFEMQKQTTSWANNKWSYTSYCAKVQDGEETTIATSLHETTFHPGWRLHNGAHALEKVGDFKCPSGSSLQGFRYVPDHDRFQMSATCLHTGVGTSSLRRTPCWNIHHKSINYLDQFDVKCKSHEVLTGFGVTKCAWSEGNPHTVNYQYKYWCASTCIPPNRMVGNECRCQPEYAGSAYEKTCRWCEHPGLVANSEQSACDDIDECAENNGGCHHSMECRDEIGSFHCECKKHSVMPDGRTVGEPGDYCNHSLSVSTSQTSSKMLLNLTGNQHYTKFNVTLSEWNPSRTSVFVLPGYPHTTKKLVEEFSGLVAGRTYRMKIQACDAGGDWDSRADFSDIEPYCGCGVSSYNSDAELTGAPIKVLAKQDLGFIRVKWVDNSLCESAFSFTRQAVNKSSATFAADYYHIDNQPCGVEHDPDSVRDDIKISDLKIGSEYRYCVRAVSAFGKLSDAECSSVHVKWEAVVRGQVTLSPVSGLLPVQGVNITWSIGPDDATREWGVVQTDRDGKYRIHIISSSLADSEQRLELRLEKTTGGVSHRFLCPDNDHCSETAFYLTHLSMNKEVNFIDDTGVEFKGRVGIAGTERPSGTTCPLANAEVCLMDANTGMRYSCGQSNHLGMYRITAVIGSHVRPEGRMNGNSLLLVDDTSYLIGTDHPVENADFESVQTENLTVEVAGGKCNRHLGKAKLTFQLATCRGWSKELKMNGVTKSWVVPAHDGLVSFGEVLDRDGKALDHVNKYFGKRFGTIQKVHLAGLPTEQGAANPDESADGHNPRLIRFEYHPQPNLTVSFAHNPLASEGVGAPHVLPSQTMTTATISAVEVFGPGIPNCDWLDGEIIITNHLGEEEHIAQSLRDTAGLSDEQIEGLTVCRHACRRPVVHDNVHQAFQIAECAGWRLVASSWMPIITAEGEEIPVVDEDIESLEQFNMQADYPSLRVRHSQVLLECGAATSAGGLESGPSSATLFQQVIDFSEGEQKMRNTLMESMVAYDGVNMSLSGFACDAENGTRFCTALQARVTTLALDVNDTTESVFAVVPAAPRCGGASTPGTWARVWVRTTDPVPTEEMQLPSECTGAQLSVQREDLAAVPRRAHVDVQLFTGSPEVNEGTSKDHPYTKLFRVSMPVEFHLSPEVTAFVAVTGQNIDGEDKWSVPLPEYEPLIVLRDPPGGNSYAEYKNMRSNINVTVGHYERYTGFTRDTTTTTHHGWKKKVTAGMSAGLGGFQANYNEVLPTFFEIDFGLKRSFHHDELRRTELKDDTSTVTLELDWSYTTNRWPTVTGKLADMFLTPTLNVVYHEANVISWNATLGESGQAQRVKQVVFSVRSDSKRPAFSWMSYGSILHTHIPDLEKLRDARLATGNATDAEAAAELQKAILGWKLTLKKHDSTLESAKQGHLNRTQHLVPESLIDGARKMDPTSKTTSKEMLKTTSTINFEGAGGALSYVIQKALLTTEGRSGTMPARMEDDTSPDLPSGPSGFHGTLEFLGQGTRTEHESLIHRTMSRSSEKIDTEDNVCSIGFTLEDRDVGDSFEVEVFIDPVYETFVFVTKRGLSKCPFEADTRPREVPGIVIKDKSMGLPVLPGNPAIFELDLQNDGNEDSSFEVFVIDTDSSGGATFFLDGAALTAPRVYESIGAKRSATAILQVFRGPEDYDYPPIHVGFRSLCDSSRQATTALNFSFVESCPTVEFAGALGSDRSFLINAATERRPHHAGELQVTARNPNVASGHWSTMERLKNIRLEYRPSGTLLWRSGVDSVGRDINAAPVETSFGFSTFWWSLRDLADGSYDLRLRAVCNSSAGVSDPPPGVDEAVSEIIVGHIDRTPPEAYGKVEPAGRDVMPGDEVAVSFLEPLQCDEPHLFGVSLSIIGTDLRLDNRNLRILCEVRRISITLPPWLPFENVMGKTGELRIWNVEDLHKNRLKVPIQHSFRFGMVSLEDFQVQISGLALAVPYSPGMDERGSPAFTAIANALAQDVASVSGADPSRVKIEAISNDAIDNSIEVLVTLTSGSRPPAAMMASALQSAIDSLNSPVVGSSGSIEQRRLMQSAQFQILQTAKPQTILRTLANVRTGDNLPPAWDFLDGGSLRSAAVALALVLIALALVLSLLQMWKLQQLLGGRFETLDKMIETKFDQEMGKYKLESPNEISRSVIRAPWSLEMSQDLEASGLSRGQSLAPPQWGASRNNRFDSESA